MVPLNRVQMPVTCSIEDTIYNANMIINNESNSNNNAGNNNNSNNNNGTRRIDNDNNMSVDTFNNTANIMNGDLAVPSQADCDERNTDIQNSNTDNREKSHSKKKSKARKVLSLLDSPRKIIFQRTNQLKRSNNEKNNKISMNSNPKNRFRHNNATEIDIRNNDNNHHEAHIPEQPSNRNVSSCETGSVDKISDDVTNTVIVEKEKMNIIGINEQETSLNVLNWISNEAPLDLMSKILSFTGPRMIKRLCCINSQWKELCLSESLWRTLCEDYGKYDPDNENDGEGDGLTENDEINPYRLKKDPHFWRHYYTGHPIVPVDYDSVESALHAISCHIYNRTIIIRNGNPRYESMEPIPVQVRSVSVLLSPGIHVLERPITIHAIANSSVKIQTWEMKANKKKNTHIIQDEEEYSEIRPSLPESDSLAKSRFIGNFFSPTKRRLRHFLNCQQNNLDSVLVPQVINQSNSTSSSVVGLDASNDALPQISKRQLRALEISNTAILVHKSPYPNQPIVRLRQGKLFLRNLMLIHDCPGTDIWNGNSAVQIQPASDRNDIPIKATFPSIPPTAIIDGVDITSASGRGVVVIDGGNAQIKKCHIHDCAATGVYIGGPGSQATMIYSDIIKNGHGNKTSRGEGVGRGHSGVYLEQGISKLTECNISHNSLTGISAVSPENATLIVEDSDLLSNGTLQLEMPQIGTPSRARSVIGNNNLSAVGTARTRSDFIIDEEIDSS